MRHDEPKKLFAQIATEVFNDVELEPLLEPLSGEIMEHKTAKRQPEARSDVRVRGFWGNKQNAFFEFRVFYPFASSYVPHSLSKLYKRFAGTRKREYEQRINQVDCGSFTPMIMASTGGMGAEMTIAMKHLASLLAEKRKEPYSKVAGLMRCRFSFAVMRSALICLRGSRDLRIRNVGQIDSSEVAMHEIRMSSAFSS